MRNLSLYRTTLNTLKTTPSSTISAVTVDLDENVIYVASEHQIDDGDVVVKVWKICREVEGDVGESSTEGSTVTLVTTFTSPAYLTSNPWTSPLGSPPEVVSFRLLPDSRTFVIIMRAGEIATASLEDEMIGADVVGSFDSGILTASWSPDDSLLALATGDDKLILMTSTFDVVSETPLHAADFGEDAPINVGWGSKQTQFHGSLGKAAAQAPRLNIVGSSPDDDELPRISWRGDGTLFVVSSLSPPSDPNEKSPDLRRRTFRIYSHAGILQSTSEPTPGLEHVLSWRPSGNWIVGTQRYGFEGGGVGREGRHDLVMFEKNGLRRHDFGLEKVLGGAHVQKEGRRKWGYRVKEVAWSSDSNVLSIWVEKDSGDIVQLWTTGNYHWYLKHEISAPSGQDGQPGRFTSVHWHPEDALKIILTTSSQVIQRTYAWETFSSKSKPPIDSGSVAVLDGASILLTPFRSQNVPPPISSYQLSVPPPSYNQNCQPLVPIHVSFSPDKDILVALWEPGYVELTDLRTRLGPGCEKIMDPVPLWSGYINAESEPKLETRAYRQVVMLSGVPSEPQADDTTHLAILGSDITDFVTVIVLERGEVKDRFDAELPQRSGRLVYGTESLDWQAPDGEIFSVDFNTGLISPASQFSEFCFETHRVQVSPMNSPGSDVSLYIGLSLTGKLYVTSSGTNRTLATNVNSFTLASGFLIFTTTAHVAQFAPLDALQSLLEQSAGETGALASVPEWESRRVERGSRIVVAIPSTMSLVLQMPRGSLETINPRPLVMKIVRQDIDRGDYLKAFTACRRHRIDLNVFVDHNREVFMRRLSDFVDQVNNVDYINLFLTSIGQGSLPPEIIADVCDNIRGELEKKDIKKYVNSILTAHVVKTPPDHEAGLALLLRLRDTEPQLVEDAVKYIIFLVDADRLFDTALGMYDFSLVLMIAQHAQKDPREYLPFLRELRALEKYYQRYRIDDHLKRYEKALQNLSLAGADRFEEAMAYVERHQLYDAALSIWRTTDKYETVLSVYGDWLFERREFKDAAFVFREAAKFSKAMVAYEKALDWQELFDLALQQNLSEEDLADMGYRVAEDLSSKKRYQDAARVSIDYAKDIRAAVIALVQGNFFSEARRIITLYSHPDLLEEIIHPGALESRAQIAEEFGEMKEQLRKQVQRLRELRVKKVEEPDAFFGVEDMDLHNVDVMTDVSMPGTTFTRYTVAPSTASRTSKRSSRSKRKMERKVGSGRKGTVDEEEYLLKSITKLVGRFNTIQADAISLLPHLFQFSEEHRKEGLVLQQELSDFEAELRQAVEEIWKKPETEGEPTTVEGWAARMQDHERQRQVNPMDKITKPDLTRNEWNPKLSTIR